MAPEFMAMFILSKKNHKGTNQGAKIRSHEVIIF